VLHRNIPISGYHTDIVAQVLQCGLLIMLNINASVTLAQQEVYEIVEIFHCLLFFFIERFVYGVHIVMGNKYFNFQNDPSVNIWFAVPFDFCTSTS